MQSSFFHFVHPASHFHRCTIQHHIFFSHSFYNLNYYINLTVWLSSTLWSDDEGLEYTHKNIFLSLSKSVSQYGCTCTTGNTRKASQLLVQGKHHKCFAHWLATSIHSFGGDCTIYIHCVSGDLWTILVVLCMDVCLFATQLHPTQTHTANTLLLVSCNTEHQMCDVSPYPRSMFCI